MVGGFNDDKTGLVDAGIMSWTWVGLHTGEDTMSGTCREGGGVNVGGESGR